MTQTRSFAPFWGWMNKKDEVTQGDALGLTYPAPSGLKTEPKELLC